MRRFTLANSSAVTVTVGREQPAREVRRHAADHRRAAHTMRQPRVLLVAVLGVLLTLGGMLPGQPGRVEALRALGLFPIAVHSHNIIFKAMMEALVERGHEVVMLSPFPNKKPRANYTDIDTALGKPPVVSSFTFGTIDAMFSSIPFAWMFNAMDITEDIAGNTICREVFSMPEFKKIMDGGYGKFDVVFTEVFGSDCWAAVPYKLGVPLITMSSAPDVSWMHDRIGSVDNPSYINNVFTDFRGRMTFWERLQNAWIRMAMNCLHTRVFNDGSDAVVREFFGDDVPPLRELVKNTSLILLNRHVSIHAARPVTPNLVHVGGLHIKGPPGQLKPELKKWMDEAEHGVIFFSLGSLMRSDSMPVAMRDALLGAFAKLPQRVLWKFESDSLSTPPNVRIAKWLPQLDILTHPKTLLFITHGGLMGTLESLHYGVPMLGLPLFADQSSNMALYRSLGIAENLDRHTMTEQSVFEQLTQMTTDKRYRDRSREVAELFRDRPRQAADEAVWWTEYVVRHGASHLRPLGADMPLYEYLLLDVAAFVVACVAVLLFAVWRLVLAATRMLTPAAPTKPKRKAA